MFNIAFGKTVPDISLDAVANSAMRIFASPPILLAAQNANWGPIQYEGELHDRATYRYFGAVLEKARVTGMALPADAEQKFFAG